MTGYHLGTMIYALITLFPAIRSGDYYLFEDSEEEEEEDEPIDTIKFGMDDDKDNEKGPSPLQVNKCCDPCSGKRG